MARRRSHFAKRMQKMRGLDSYEKGLLVRIGELIDGMINNRGPTNPSEPGRTRRDRRLPPPKLINHEPGIRTAKLSWDAVDSSILNYYKVVVTSLDTGATEEFISYTNAFFFKGREGGNYEAKIRSVGRNGTESEATTISFFITEDVMLLEGTKNSFNTLGTIVFDDIFFSLGHKVFAWCAFTIDKLIGGATTGNSNVAARLYIGDENATSLSQATFLEEITFYKATESLTCFATDALGGNITRPDLQPPANTDPDFIRGTTYETSYSVMFSPLVVTEARANKLNTLFVQIVGRETEADVTGLSLTLWTANEGTAAQQPSDPFVGEPAVVKDDRYCIELHSGYDQTDAADQWIHSGGQLTEAFNVIGEAWSIAFWVKWERIGSLATLFEIWEPIPPSPSTQRNQVLFQVQRTQAGADGRITTTVQIGDSTGSTGLWTRNNLYNVAGAPDQDDPDLQVNDDDWLAGSLNNVVWRFGLLDQWHLILILFDPTNGVRFFKPAQFVSPNSNTTVGLVPDNTGRRSMVVGANAAPLYPGGVFAGEDATSQNPAVCRIHSMGWWNKLVRTSPEQVALYNGGEGVDGQLGDIIHWRDTHPEWPNPYYSGGNLIHYWQFGVVRSARKWVGRDTGLNPLPSGGLDGDLDLTDDATSTTGPAKNFSIAQNVVNDYPGND